MLSQPRVLFAIITFAFLSICFVTYRNHMDKFPMSRVSIELKRFHLDDPTPQCADWKSHMPRSRDAPAYEIYMRARKLWRSKVEWKLTREELRSIFEDVQRAAIMGDWGARALLATFYREGLGPLDTNRVLDPEPKKSIEIIRAAIDAGQAWGYYDLGVAYEYGYGDVPRNVEIAWAYYLRAAELGSPEAQMTLAEAYNKAKRWDDGRAMMMCAFRQGHGPAAYRLGLYAEVFQNFGDSLNFFQQGVKFGSRESADALLFLFRNDLWHQKPKEERDRLIELEIYPDEDRASRYRTISEALELNPDLRFSRLESVLPLPPADLPDWGGIEAAMSAETIGSPTY